MLNDNFVTFEIGKAKHIALVAHDGKKKELIEWCDKNKEILKGHFLCGTEVWHHGQISNSDRREDRASGKGI